MATQGFKNGLRRNHKGFLGDKTRVGRRIKHGTVNQEPLEGADNGSYRQLSDMKISDQASEPERPTRAVSPMKVDWVTGSDVPWPNLVRGFLDELDNEHTRRAYFRHLQEWLPRLPGGDIKLIECRDLVEIRTELLRDSRGEASHQQALASLQAFFVWLRWQYRFPSISDNSFQKILGSGKSSPPSQDHLLSES